MANGEWLHKELQALRDDMQDEFRALRSDLKQTYDRLKEHMDERDQRFEKRLDSHSKRIRSLENWRNYVTGAAALIGLIFGRLWDSLRGG